MMGKRQREDLTAAIDLYKKSPAVIRLQVNILPYRHYTREFGSGYTIRLTPYECYEEADYAMMGWSVANCQYDYTAIQRVAKAEHDLDKAEALLVEFAGHIQPGMVNKWGERIEFKTPDTTYVINLDEPDWEKWPFVSTLKKIWLWKVAMPEALDDGAAGTG